MNDIQPLPVERVEFIAPRPELCHLPGATYPWTLSCVSLNISVRGTSYREALPRYLDRIAAEVKKVKPLGTEAVEDFFDQHGGHTTYVVEARDEETGTHLVHISLAA